MISRARGILAAMVFGYLTTQAGAGVIVDPTSNRFVDADVSNPPASQTFTAPDANPFNQTASATVTFNNSVSTMTASQNSSFGVVGSQLSASVSSLGSLATTDLPGSIANADSQFNLDFTLDSAGTFSLTGNAKVAGLIADPGFYASYIIRLQGPGAVTVFDFRDDTLPPNVTSDIFNDTGALAAGSYHLVARALSTGSGNVNALGQLDIQFGVNSPGGSNGSGGPQAPLPPAVWVGLALGAGVVGRRVRMGSEG
jgi:hypothetical protein